MTYYSVLIVYEERLSEHGNMEHRAESEYFGEDETMMRVKFFEAARKAAQIPEAVSLVVVGDEVLVNLPIRH